jgi:hypothetical protein
MRKGPGSAYDKWNISVVICNTDIPTRLIRRVSLMEHELLTLPERLSSPLVFSGVRVTRSLVLCVCFVDPLFVLLASSCVPYEDRVYFAIFEMVTSQKKLNSNNNKL